jgi:hypothetical protein
VKFKPNKGMEMDWEIHVTKDNFEYADHFIERELS